LDEASRSLEKFAKNTTISVACRGNGIIEITVDAPGPKTAFQLLKKVAKQVRVVYSWTAQETAQLRELWEQTHDLNSIAEAMNKSVEAVRMKLKRLGLRDDDQLQEQRSTTRESVLPVDIMTHEEVLKILAGAIARLQQPDLEKREVMQLRVLADMAKTYDSLLEKFERWVEVEAKILEMEKRLNELQKGKAADAP